MEVQPREVVRRQYVELPSELLAPIWVDPIPWRVEGAVTNGDLLAQLEDCRAVTHRYEHRLREIAALTAVSADKGK